MRSLYSSTIKESNYQIERKKNKESWVITVLGDLSWITKSHSWWEHSSANAYSFIIVSFLIRTVKLTLAELILQPPAVGLKNSISRVLILLMKSTTTSAFNSTQKLKLIQSIVRASCNQTTLTVHNSAAILCV